LKIKDIYDLAVRILGKNSVASNDEEFLDRTPYIMAIFCCNTAKLDRDFRESHNLPTQNHFNEVYLNLDEDFPLDSRFSAPAAQYLASMLVADDKESVSEKLFGMFVNNISDILHEIPAKKYKILNFYP